MSMTVVWFLIVFAAAIAAFFIGRYTAPGSARVRELEEQRDESSRELRFYREQVNGHFQTTAKLFNDVTASYRSLYEHLAEGSEKLGRGPDSPLLSTPPEQRQLEEQLAAQDSGDGQAASDAVASAGNENDERTPEQPSAASATDDEPAAQDAGSERWSLDDMKPRAEAQAEQSAEETSDEQPDKKA